MKAKELMEWIKQNHAEELEMMVNGMNRGYLDVTDVWESEAKDGAVMLETTPGKEGAGNLDEIIKKAVWE